MARRAAVITINLNAGTAQLVQGFNQAGAVVGNFGKQATAQFVTMSAGLRELEGNFTSNTRAVARFLSQVVGLGPAMQALFPLVGGIAFLGLIGTLIGKMGEFIKSVSEAGTKSAEAFREMLMPMQLSGDQLQLRLDQLDQQIAKLEGRPTNQLKVSLDEATIAAADLNKELTNMINNLAKTLGEQKVGFFNRLFLGEPGTEDIVKRIEGAPDALKKELFKIVDGHMAELRSARQAGDQAKFYNEEHKMMDEILTRLGKSLGEVNDQLAAEPAGLANAIDRISKGQFEVLGPGGIPGGVTQAMGGQRLEQLNDEKKAILAMQDLVRLRQGIADREHTKNLDEDKKRYEELGRPYQERLEAITSQIKGLQTETAAIGKGEEAKEAAKAYAEWEKTIDEVNKRRKELGEGPLPGVESAALKSLIGQKVGIEAQKEWKTAVEQSNVAAQIELKNLQERDKAIGLGAEAQKKANVEMETNKFLGQHINDVKFQQEKHNDILAFQDRRTAIQNENYKVQADEIKDKLEDQIKVQDAVAAGWAKGGVQAELAGVKEKARLEAIKLGTDEIIPLREQEFLGQQKITSAEQAHKLDQQIALERAAAEAWRDGAGAVKEQTFALQLLQLQADKGINANIDQLRALHEAQKAVAAEEMLYNLNLEIKARQDLAEATKSGTEAAIEQAAKTKALATFEKTGGGLLGMAVSVTEYYKDIKDHQADISIEASNFVNTTANQLEHIRLIQDAMSKMSEAQKQSVEFQYRWNELQDTKLKLIAQEVLMSRRAQDGMKAFFVEMQTQAKSTAMVIYEALNATLDKLSENMAKLLTGQKTEWSKAFRDIGQQIVKSEVEADIHAGLGAVAKHYGIGKDIVDKVEKQLGMERKPSGTESDPIYTVQKGTKPGTLPIGASPTPGGSDTTGGGGGLFGGGSQGGMIFSAISSLWKLKTAAAATTWSADFGALLESGAMAAQHGASVTPGQAYMVGERGPEMFISASPGTIVPHGAGAFGGNVTYNIDARGSDLGASNRIQRGLELSHRAAVVSSVVASTEHGKRVPQK
jgi:hypothetical protein